MKVKISLTVELDEVLDNVSPVLEKSIQNLIFSVDQLNSIKLEKNNILENIEYVEKARKAISDADIYLGDIHSILLGYNRVLAESMAPQQEMTDDNDDVAQ